MHEGITPGRHSLIAILLLMPWMMAHASRLEWREMTVGHFHLISMLSESKTRDIARHVQAFESTVGLLLRQGEPLPQVPTLMLVLSRHDYRQYAAPHSGTSGYFFARSYENLIVIDGEYDFEDVMETVYHEYTHYIQSSSTTATLPPWYEEGYAELFSSFKLRDSTISLGGVPLGVRLSMDDWIPMERLLAVKQSDPEYRTETLMPQFYAESWILVHMLLFDDQTYAEPTVRYLSNMDMGLLEPDAFAKSFAFSKEDLDKALKQLIRKRAIRVKRLIYKNALAIQEVPVTAVAPARAALWLARIAFGEDRPLEALQPLLDEALKSADTRIAAEALQARILAHSRKPVDLVKLSDPWNKGGVDEPQIRIDLASALLTPGQNGSAAALDILNDLVKSGDAPLESVGLWSEAALDRDVDAARIKAVLDAAVKRAPENTRLLQQLAATLEAMGDKPGAKAAYSRIILISRDPDERLWAQKQADSRRLSAHP